MSTALLRDNVSRNTIDALEYLLEGARQGHITGLAFAAMMRRRRYFVNVAGTAFDDPTFARGCVGALEDELRVLIQGKADASTTL